MATKTITGIKAGKTSIIASYSDGGVTKTASVNFTVNKIAGSSGKVSNPASQVYKDGTQTNYSFQLGITGATGTVTYPTSITVKKGSTTITGWTCTNSGVLTVPYTQGAGTYTVTGNITVAESTNYNAVGATSKTWTITITQKNDASVSVTLASNAGTYGEDAILVTAANSSSHGTSAAYIGYKYGSAATADSEITWVNVGKALTLNASASAGTYYIYKKWTADSNHSNSSTYTQVGTTYTLTRSKATPTLTLNNTNAIFHNTAKITATASVAGTIYWGTSSTSMTNSKTVSAKTAVDLTTRTTLGDTTVYAYFVPTDTTNYNSLGSSSSAHASKTMSVTKASDASVSVTLASNAGSYNSAATLVTAANSSSHGTSEAKIGYKLGAATADSEITWVNVGTALTLNASASAGTYYIYKKWTADSNHSNSSTYTQVGTLTRSTIAGSTGVSISDMHIVYSNTTGTRTASGNTGTLSVASSNTNIATVSVSGTTITVTRKGYGSATITVTAQATTNYNSATSQFTIYCDKAAGQSGSVSNPAAKTFSTSSQTAQLGISGATGTVTYPTSITVKNSGGTSVSGWSCTSAGVVTIPASQTVGTYTVTGNITVAEATNYYAVGATSKSWTITINRASFTATVSMSGYTYGGSLPSGKPSVSNNPGSGSVSYYYSKSNSNSGGTAWSNMTSTSLNAGTYYMYAVIGETTNYKGYTTSAVQFTVSAADFTVSGTGNKSYVYNGSAQGTGVSVSGLKGSQTATIKYGSSSGSYTSTSVPQATTVVESKTVYWQVTAPNHNTKTGSYTLTIAKRPIKVTAATDSKVYDSKPLTNNNATAEATDTSANRGLAPNQSMTSCTVEGSITNAGSTPNIPSGAVIKSGSTDTTANYDITYVNGTLTVSQKPVTITAPTLTTGTITYNGENQYLSSAGSTSAGTIYYYVSTSPTTPTFSTSTWSISRPIGQNATTYYLWYFVSVNANNYSGSGINTVIKIETGSKVINQKALTVTAASDSKEYDGNPLTINSATLSGNVSGHKLYSATYGGSQTTVGSSNSTVKDAVIKSGSTTVTDNYAITYAKGTLTVTSASFTVGNKSNKTYTWTGSPQGTGVTVSNVKGGQTVTIKYKTKSTDDYTLTSAPQITNVPQSPLTVYWKVTVPNHTTQTGSYTITINKADATACTTWEGDSKGYDEAQITPATLTYEGYSGGTIKFRYDTNGGASYGDATTTAPTRSTVGTTSVQYMIEGDSNHNSTGWSDTVTLTVNAETDTHMTVTLTARTYSGGAQVIATGGSLHAVASYKIGYIRRDIGTSAPSAPTSDSQLTWGSNNSSLSATNAGDYYVYYTMSPGTGHTNSKTREYVGKVTISKASRSGAVSFKSGSTTVTSTIYPNTVNAVVSGNTENGTITWSVINGTTGKATVNSSGVVTPTQAGTVTVNATIAETANYKAYKATSAELTIKKATGAITYNTVTSVSEYCTSTAAAMSQTDANKSVVVATSSASSSTNTGATIGYTINSVTKGDSSFTGWTVSTDGQTVTVPKGTVAGTYSVKITATAPTTTNYNTVSIQNTVSIVITATVLTDLRMTLTANSVAYNSSTTVASVTAEYNNGATKSVLDSATYTSNPTGIVTIS